MEPSKKLYIIIGVLVLVVLILFLIWFFTKGNPSPGGEEESTVSLCSKEITCQGVVYKVVEIGKQCWLAENLRTSSYRDGTVIPKLTDYTEWAEDKQGAYTCYYNFEEHCDNYGALYNWYAVNNEKGLCPEGWSVPSQEQWTELERAVCQNLGYQDCQERFPDESASGWRGTDEGLHLRAVDSEGKDSYGFKALFGGFRNAAGPYSFLNEKGFWWTSTAAEDIVYGRVMDGENDGIRQVGTMKSSGFSVRCVKN